MDLDLWITLLLSSIALSITPGTSTVITMDYGLKYGVRKTMFVILGLQAAFIIQILTISLGVGAIIVGSQNASNIVKWVGILILIGFGLYKFFEKVVPFEHQKTPKKFNKYKAFTAALFFDISNPQTIAFLLAFIAQFIDSTRPLWSQLLIICLTMVIVDVMAMTGYATMGSKLGFLIQDKKAIKIQNIAIGSFLIGAAIFLYFSQ